MDFFCGNPVLIRLLAASILKAIAVNHVSMELIVSFTVAYVFIALVIAGIGAQRTCGYFRTFLFSILLTPVTGLVYVLSSSHRSVLKTVHYRCSHCGLEYTTEDRYCHICAKEGHKYKLRKISMKTY